MLASIALACLAGGAAAPPVRPLAIVQAALHQFEDGPALPAGFQFLPGDTVFLSFQVANYKASEKERMLLAYRVDTRDAEGIPLAEPVEGKIDAELAPEDKSWLPKVRYNVLVPPHAGPGAYRTAAVVKDEIGGAEARYEVAFQVGGRAIEPSAELAIRNFRFLRGEEDGEGLARPVYRPGGALWARFEITGFRLGEKNRMDVRYGVSVLRPGGEALFSEPEAASEQDAPFYPKRYVPGALSLKLDPDIAAGEYTVVVAVRDEVGRQRVEARGTFRIE